MIAPGLDPGDLLRLYSRESRDPTPPHLVRDLFADPWGTPLDVLGVVLAASWARGAGGGAVGWPLLALPRADWLAMFDRVGYLHNGFRVPAMRPRESIRLYRGSTHKHRRGLSWTTREADARFYAGRYRGAPGFVYEIEAPPSWLLARFSPSLFAPGGEYVVNVPKGAVRLLDADEGAR